MLDDIQTKDDIGSIKTLLKVLSKHYDILVSAGSDKTLLKEYSALLKFLRSMKREEFDRIFSRTSARLPKLPQSQPQFDDSEIVNFSIAQLDNLINEEGTSRKLLERIAIHRFNVPAGSMRSFSNRRMLVEKLLTLVQNEQAHSTIDSVARG